MIAFDYLGRAATGVVDLYLEAGLSVDTMLWHARGDAVGRRRALGADGGENLGTGMAAGCFVFTHCWTGAYAMILWLLTKQTPHIFKRRMY